MADQVLKVTDGVIAGVLSITTHANQKIGTAAGTDQFLMPNDGKTVLVVVATAAAKDIVFTAVANQWGRVESVADRTVSPTGTNTSIFGPFPPRLWNNSDGQVEFDPDIGGVATDHYLALRVL